MVKAKAKGHCAKDDQEVLFEYLVGVGKGSEREGNKKDKKLLKILPDYEDIS
jgi:hypothetical protein